MAIRINLPQMHGADDSEHVRMLYDSATRNSTHVASLGTGSPSFALPKQFDPSRRGMQTAYGAYGADDIMQFDTNDEIRNRILLACRNIQETHPVVAACISVISRYCVQGLKLQHQDADMERFYTELFLEDLDFEDFLVQVGESYWCDGMAYIYGSWSDELGVWTGEDILDPTGVKIVHIPFGVEDVFEMVPGQELKDALRSQSDNAILFKKQHPDIYKAVMSGQNITLSNDRVTFIAQKSRPSKTYGTPPMLKAWDTLRLEDRLHNAMEATADRLYAPLLMFTIGGTLPNGDHYIPSSTALDAFRDNLDLALASNFRAIVTHDGVSSTEVVRMGNNLSAYKQDLDMYDARIFSAFGLSDAIMKPQSGTYATSALEFQLTSQILASYQKVLKGIYNRQAAMVAEAQQHYQKDNDGEVLYDRRLMWDPDADDGAGAEVVKETPKLDFPEIMFNNIDFKDEQNERDFRMKLKQAGVPIADSDIAVGVDFDLNASRDKFNDEQIEKSVDEARVQSSIFNATYKQGLPVPAETAAYFKDGITPEEYESLVKKFAPTIKDDSSQGGSSPTAGSGSPDDERMTEDGDGQRPEVSDEQRADMPKA